MDKNSKIYIAGHTGLIGSALLQLYKKKGYKNIITKTKIELDLRIQNDVNDFFLKEKPEYVILAAAKVGGIKANIDHPFEFMYDNLMIQSNVIVSAYKNNVKKLINIACGCAYPTNAKQPIKEEYLLTDKPEPTNEGFAISKIAGIKLCEKIYSEFGRIFISCVPANTYGINDHLSAERSHVIPALFDKFYNAKINNSSDVTLWGTGNARREFIYVDDIAQAIFLLMGKYNKNELINIGTGEDVTIKELSDLIKHIVGYEGDVIFDTNKPDGMQKRLLDNSKINTLGFIPTVSLNEGLKKTFVWYLQSKK